MTLAEALTGFRAAVRHLDGKNVHMSCERQVTRPGQLRRIRGLGMPSRAGGSKGDMFVRFSVRFPTQPLAAENAKLLKQLLPRSAVGGAGPIKPEPGERVHRPEDVRQEEDEDSSGDFGI